MRAGTLHADEPQEDCAARDEPALTPALSPCKDPRQGGRVFGDKVDRCRPVAAAWPTMPWPVKDLLTLRLEFVQLALLPDANVRQLCRRFRISPTVGYKWLARFAAGGAEALADRSRRPRHSPDRTAAEVEAAVVALRREHPAWGARKLRRRLHDLGHAGLPAPSTLTGILHRHPPPAWSHHPGGHRRRHAPCAH